jgi:hypothetical protein
MTNEDQAKPASNPLAQRLLCALDLMELGIELMRQSIIRRRPDASIESVNLELQAWIKGAPAAQSERGEA